MQPTSSIYDAADNCNSRVLPLVPPPVMQRVYNNNNLPDCNFLPSHPISVDAQSSALTSSKRKARPPTTINTILTASDEKKLKKIKKSEMDLRTIIDCNEKRFSHHITIDENTPLNAGRRLLTTPPVRKKLSSTLVRLLCGAAVTFLVHTRVQYWVF